MKKSIYILLTLLVCFCFPLHAYEYFTVYYIDGTKSEPFYATDVESIEYSKIDLDGIEHADWQVQEIHTVDSIYRYSLASIKYIDFKDVDENVVAHDIATVSEAIAPLFNECQSALQLSERLSVIQNINGVEDAYISNQTLFVKIRDWGYLSFLYPTNDSVTDDEFELVPKNNETNLRRSNRTNEHQHTEVLKACVVNQQFRDDNRKFFQTIAEQFRVSFADMGIDPKIVNMPSPDFFQNEMFDYDILFIKTHGSYDEKSNLHWLCTGEELLTKDPQYGLSDTQIGSLINQILLNFHHFAYSSRKMGFSWIPERRNGDSIHVLYTTISDEFISSAKRNFRNAGSAIVFNTACESMKENNKMAQAFEKRGAGCYLGYDDPDRVGGHAGKHFWAHLLVGRSILGAIKAMPDWSKEEKFYIDKNGKEYDVAPSGKITIKCNPKLKIYPSNSSLCITHPKTLSVENPSEDIILKGQMKCAYIQGAYDNMSIGFQYGTSYDMSQAKTIGYENTYYDSSTRYMNWYATLNKSDLQPASTYYYRAYMYDGHSYCYGETMSFTTPLCPDENHPHMIDLGLPSGTKWACCNVGASTPEGYGNYYAWGETQPKSVYTWDTYAYWHENNGNKIVNIGSDIAGTNCDAATANWGAPWCMPSLAQCQELIDNCTSEWTTQNSIYGRKFTGPNGGTIFLPAAGTWFSTFLDAVRFRGYYWSSSLYDSWAGHAWYLYFSSSYAGMGDYGRFGGQSVRPVRTNL